MGSDPDQDQNTTSGMNVMDECNPRTSDKTYNQPVHDAFDGAIAEAEGTSQASVDLILGQKRRSACKSSVSGQFACTALKHALTAQNQTSRQESRSWGQATNCSDQAYHLWLKGVEVYSPQHSPNLHQQGGQWDSVVSLRNLLSIASFPDVVCEKLDNDILLVVISGPFASSSCAYLKKFSYFLEWVVSKESKWTQNNFLCVDPSSTRRCTPLVDAAVLFWGWQIGILERMKFSVISLAVLLKAEDCPTNQYTDYGECCHACGIGEGVVQLCGANQTVCETCLDSVTFSNTTSHTEACKPCTECIGDKRMLAPCVETDDAVCACAYGTFLGNGECKPCQSCPKGYGMTSSCASYQDTACEICPEWTYSDVDNSVDPCLPCTICEYEEIKMEECTNISDTECYDPSPRVTVSTFMPALDLSTLASTISDPEASSTTPRSSEPVHPSGAAENLIPVYCSILAAVIAGLVAFIVFKRWNSCKQHKQGGNSHPVNQTPSPEGEKLHSDSGISVNSDSTAEQPAGHTQGKNDLHLYNNLSHHKQEEVEKLLTGSLEQTWKCLAGELGYQDELIDSFTREEFPVRALLTDWSTKDSATTDALYSALRKIQREDIAQSLYSDSTATSPV
ncbi:tumor necrosis factor receptor superfamily member 16 [Pelodytes ibericus]